MTGFKTLQDVSSNFQLELKQVSNELFSTKTGESFEQNISKKLQDLSLFSAKLRLLRASTLAVTPQVLQRQKGENTLKEYDEEAACKVLEQLTVKCVTQSNAVKNLITAQNKTLDPAQIDKKQKIITALSLYRQQEFQLRQFQSILGEREAEHTAVREEWDRVLGELRDVRNESCVDEEFDTSSPLYLRLQKLVDKLEMIRWLIGRLVCARGHRDWMGDPKQALAALKLARTANTVEMFTDT